MKSLLLISPAANSGLVGRDFHFQLPVLGLLRVAALTPSSWRTIIRDEKVEPLDLNQEADLVGITVMTTTAPRAYEIADYFRRRGLKVVLGGMHVSALPEDTCSANLRTMPSLLPRPMYFTNSFWIIMEQGRVYVRRPRPPAALSTAWGGT